MTPTEILKYYEARREAIIASIREIVDIESPSRDGAQSKLVVDWIEKSFREVSDDLKIERIAAAGFGEHVLIKAFPSDTKHTLLLGHTDTVHPVGTNLKNPTRIEGDKFYGCGIFDMKANIVLMFEALRYFAFSGTRPSSSQRILGNHSNLGRYPKSRTTFQI